MSEPELRDDDASLYVLGLLDEQERQAFEARLATQPALLDEVRALETNLEGLALAAPPRTPPPHVWARIVERTSRPDRPATPVLARLVQAIRAGWAVAGLIALAWLVQELAGSRERVPASVAGEPSASSRPATRTSRPGEGQPQGVLRERPPGTATPVIAGQGKPPSPGAGERHLQERVQMLSEQLTALTRALVERPVLPPGSAQLQLFKLVGTNHSAEPQEIGGVEVHGATPSETGGRLQLALVLAAAHQFAAQASASSKSASETAASSPAPAAATPAATANSPGVGSTTASTPSAPAEASTPTDRTPATDTAINTAATIPTTVETVPPDPEPIQVVDLTSANEPPPQSAASHISTNLSSTLTMTGGAAAFGAYSVDTGFGAIAFRTLPNPLDGVYQLWVADGSPGTTFSVGFVQSKSPVVVMNFQTSLTSSTQPVFFITAEPAGGSLIPTGPIVALPPTSSPNP